jgi:beta-glucosidase
MALLANHYVLLGHARATGALRRASKAPVGIALNVAPFLPSTEHELDRAAARRGDGSQNRMFLGPLFKGEYPADMVEHYSRHKPGLDVATPEDMAAISSPLDFLALNYYNANMVADLGRLEEARRAGRLVGEVQRQGARAELRIAHVGRSDVRHTGAAWEVDPWGLTDTLVRLRDEYTSLPLYVTENGSAEQDYAGPDGAVHDPMRVWYLGEHIKAAHAAIAKGVDLRGYFIWSLLDNFEWSHGFSMRFGLIYVDYPTGKRVPKDSYRWYKEVIAASGLA